MRLGLQPTLVTSGNRLFSRQGHWDGGSMFHCVAMALAMLGKLADPGYLRCHASGPEQMLGDVRPRVTRCGSMRTPAHSPRLAASRVAASTTT
ncbi:hypothetical protein DF118_35050 [Burkholderia stagnalis]|nr:hypothetical protein DF149_34680 [Burkholderia stagnalis]RQQ39720.1 hypothetical protein DF162_34960 [Burkholderia stagnalis]RQX85166.1 hypothetical protein DF119_35715 [Burkholderia stagnalis]RQX99928.1 hypothetical protein DF118_35050 [Burkholderia stagnalis]RQY27166.1 hypothetical protein DF116_35815 [Burkholderia stagnalis]